MLGLEYKHSGEIKCIASIPTHPDSIATTVYADLVVLPTPTSTLSIETNPSVQPEVPAYIVRGPEDCSVLTGGTVTLDAIFGGYSQPTVKWYRAVSERFYLKRMNYLHSEFRLLDCVSLFYF